MITIEQVAHTTGFDVNKLIESVIEYWEIPDENREAVSKFTELTSTEAVYLAGHFRPEEKIYSYDIIFDFVKEHGSVLRSVTTKYLVERLDITRRSAERMILRAQNEEPRLRDNIDTAETRCKVCYYWSEPDGK